MKQSDFIKEDWTVEYHDHHRRWRIFARGSSDIYGLCELYDNDDADKARACLMSAAPELLAACELMLDQYGYCISPVNMDVVRVAILKARQS